MNDGIDPRALSDGDGDISKAKAATGLFKTTNSHDSSLDVDNLFNQVNEYELTNDVGGGLFENVLEYTSAPVALEEPVANNFYISTVIVLLLIFAYIYYLIQSRRMSNMISVARIKLNEF